MRVVASANERSRAAYTERPRLRPMAMFLIGDVMASFAEVWMFAGMEGASPSATQGDILAAAIVRGVAMLWLIHAALRDPAPGWAQRMATAH